MLEFVLAMLSIGVKNFDGQTILYYFLPKKNLSSIKAFVSPECSNSKMFRKLSKKKIMPNS